jgi:hypothetical protein
VASDAKAESRIGFRKSSADGKYRDRSNFTMRRDRAFTCSSLRGSCCAFQLCDACVEVFHLDCLGGVVKDAFGKLERGPTQAR